MKEHEFFEQRHNFYLSLSRVGQGGLTLAVLLGLLAFAGGLAAGEQARTWGSVLLNLMFFFSLALGGIAFGNMQDVVGATWGRPIKRLHEAFGVFIPWAVGFFILFLMAIKFDLGGAKNVYRWVADPHMLEHFPGKNLWLQLDFMILRDIGALLAIWALSRWHLRLTIAGDVRLVAGQQEEARRLGEHARATLRYWSAPVLVVYALCFSLICFDLTMSLAPTWLSTLWGGWSFAVMMQMLMAMTLLMMFFLKDTSTGQYFRRQQFHDIGKLLFGFTVFYAYLTYAHVLTYWYGNIPEETSYFLTRLEAPWVYLVILIPFTSFLLPLFALIPKVSKWARPITVPICVIVLISQWLNYFLVVIPEISPASQWAFPWIEVGIFFGFLGLFFFSVYRFGSKVPMLSIADPLLSAALHDEH